MHVLYLHQHFTTPEGAVGTRSYEMAKRLIYEGHRVTMVCGSYGGSKSGLCSEFVKGRRDGIVDGIHVVEFQLPYSNHDNFVRRTWIFIQFAFRSIVLSLTLPYDVLFATSTPLTAGIPGIVMKLFKRRLFVFEVRDLWPELPREMGVITNPIILKAMDLLEWLSYHSADACVGLSPGIVKGITRRNIPSEIVEMIPNGCDIDLFKPISNQGINSVPNIEENDFVAIFCGAHGIANGLDAVLDVASVLKKRNVNEIKFLFVGDGKLKPRLLERANSEQLNNCVFCDPMPKKELVQIIARADVGLMVLADVPAFYYGTSPNKFFDYIASGLPVVNNYPGWLAELIVNNNCGMVVPPRNPEAFANALIQLSGSKEECRIMGENARKLAEGEFNREYLTGRFVSFIENLHLKRR